MLELVFKADPLNLCLLQMFQVIVEALFFVVLLIIDVFFY